MLNKGVTKACHNLLLKRVEELKPSDSQLNEWNLTTFLDSKKQIIIKSKLSKEKFKVLFPETGFTVLSKWDLSLFCEVLISYCDLTKLEQKDIKRIRHMRNTLCHMNDAEITNAEFKDKSENIEAIIGRILEKLGDEDLKIEVNTIIKTLESGPLSLDEVYKLFLMDMHGRFDQVLEKYDEQDGKMEAILYKRVQMESSGNDSVRTEDLVPDTYADDEVEKLEGQGNIMPTMKSDDVKISKSCTQEKEKEISFKFKDEEEKYNKAAIKQRSLDEIDPTKEAHAKGKYQSREKEEIAKQINWKRFTFTVNNQLCEPFFNNSVTMGIEDEKSPLIRYMKKAVNERNGLMEKFTVTYFSGGLGYFIEAINDARGTYSVDESFWQIRLESGPANVGISSFIPEDGMEVVLDLVTGRYDDKLFMSQNPSGVPLSRGHGKSFTLTVKSQLSEPSFKNSVTMNIEDEDISLIKYMEKAVDENNGLMHKFTVTYEANSECKIEAIDDAKVTSSSDNLVWMMKTQLGPTQMGISSFIPENEMNVLLELTTKRPDYN